MVVANHLEYKGTTAGYKNTYSYDKLIQFLVWSIVKPEKAMIMGGTYRIPVLVKLLDKNFVADLRMDGTFNESSFAREYSLYDLYSLNIVNCGKPNFYQKNGNPQPSLLIRGRFNDYAALMQSLAQYGIIMKGCYYFEKYKNK